MRLPSCQEATHWPPTLVHRTFPNMFTLVVKLTARTTSPTLLMPKRPPRRALITSLRCRAHGKGRRAWTPGRRARGTNVPIPAKSNGVHNLGEGKDSYFREALTHVQSNFYPGIPLEFGLFYAKVYFQKFSEILYHSMKKIDIPQMMGNPFQPDPHAFVF